MAWNEIQQARQYSKKLIADVAPSDWFWMPAGGVTHLAWQVGHLAIAQYRLTMMRLRGERPEDESIIAAQEWAPLFGIGSTPVADPARYPAPEEILATQDRVFEAARRELAEMPDAECDAPSLVTHAWFRTKLQALFWCARHEMMHAGQIGLLRRLQGKQPLW